MARQKYKIWIFCNLLFLLARPKGEPRFTLRPGSRMSEIRSLLLIHQPLRPQDARWWLCVTEVIQCVEQVRLAWLRRDDLEALLLSFELFSSSTTSRNKGKYSKRKLEQLNANSHPIQQISRAHIFHSVTVPPGVQRRHAIPSGEGRGRQSRLKLLQSWKTVSIRIPWCMQIDMDWVERVTGYQTYRMY